MTLRDSPVPPRQSHVRGITPTRDNSPSVSSQPLLDSPPATSHDIESTLVRPSSSPETGEASRTQQDSYNIIKSCPSSTGLSRQSAHAEPSSPEASPMPDSTLIDLNSLTDDNVLHILLNNETVAEQLRMACFSRQQRYQEDLEHVYNQRLSELEDYTRKWRDTTKELWRAFERGKIPVITQQQQDALDWQGPRQSQPSFQDQIPSNAPSLEQQNLDHEKNGERAGENHLSAAPTNLQESTPGHQSFKPMPPTQLSCLEWVQDLGGYMKNYSTGEYTDGSDRLIRRVISSSLGHNFPGFSLSGEVMDTCVLVRVPSAQAMPTYRRLASINELKFKVDLCEVVVDLNSANIALFGKAFCYISDRIDILRAARRGRSPTSVASTIDDKKCRLYDMFSSRVAPKTLTSSGPPPQSPRSMVSYHFETESRRKLYKLMILRPAHKSGEITGVRHFDVGLEQEVPYQGQGECSCNLNFQVVD